jgi:hypothetical protein
MGLVFFEIFDSHRTLEAFQLPPCAIKGTEIVTYSDEDHDPTVRNVNTNK